MKDESVKKKEKFASEDILFVLCPHCGKTIYNLHDLAYKHNGCFKRKK